VLLRTPFSATDQMLFQSLDRIPDGHFSSSQPADISGSSRWSEPRPDR
jgi:hypothetical protein